MSPNGAAYLAGIRPGDIILQIDNKAVNSTSETLGVIGQFHPNDEVEVMVKRSEKPISFKVRLQGE
jgi:S1-C subfamily serine protease